MAEYAFWSSPVIINDLPVFYNPQSEGREKFLKERLDKLWTDRYK